MLKKADCKDRIPLVGVLGFGAGIGVRERVMAWTPWKVPARMSMSFAVRCWRGEVWVVDVEVLEEEVVLDMGALWGGRKLRW